MQTVTKSLTASALLLSVMAASTASAAIVYADLDFAAAGNYYNEDLLSDPAVAATVVSTAQTLVGDTGTATFNIVYTLGAIATAANPYVASTGSVYGVRGDTGTAATIDGDEGNGISFLNLSITDFEANGSGFVVGDIADLSFTGLSYGVAGHAQDGAFISFDNFNTQDQQHLHTTITGANDPSTIFSVAGYSNYDGPETDLYLKADNASARNRFTISGIQVSYTSPVPEPSSYALLAGFVGLSYVMVRRRK